MRDRVAEAAQREIDRRASMTVVVPATGDGMIVVEFGPEGLSGTQAASPATESGVDLGSAAPPRRQDVAGERNVSRPAPESQRAVMHIPRSEALDRLSDLREYLDEILASREENG